MTYKTVYWNVDTQNDFMKESGKLAVPGAEAIEGNLEKITKHAKENNIQVVNTCDWHNVDSKEFSETPDFVNTFPPHCLAGTNGAEYVDATTPKNPYIINWDRNGIDLVAIENHKGDYVIRKDAFSVFEGNFNTEGVLSAIKPDEVIVYGVATNYCVKFAVEGLVERGYNVSVVTDAMKGLPTEDETNTVEAKLKEWEGKGVKLLTTEELLKR